MNTPLTLKQLRDRRGISIRTLAALADVSTATIVSAEAGRPLRLGNMQAIAGALGVRPVDVAEFARQFGIEVREAVPV